MNKYHAKKTTIDGNTFDSMAEARRYSELEILQSYGEISGLKTHPRFLLVDGFIHDGKRERPIYYVADFEYFEGGAHVVEDVKGGKATQTAVFQVKRKMFLSLYGKTINFRIVER